MKNVIRIMLAAILLMSGAIIAIVVGGRKTAVATTAGSSSLRIQVQSLPPLMPVPPGASEIPAVHVQVPTPATPVASVNPAAKRPFPVKPVAVTPAPIKPASVTPASAPPASVPTKVTESVQQVDVTPRTVANAPAIPEPAKGDSDRVLKYVARPGDSVSALAAGLLGEDSKPNRDAIISENRSLQNDPDRVIAGKTYTIPTSTGLSAAPESPSAPAPLPAAQPDADEVIKIGAGRELRYTAIAGDTVSKLARILLGSETQASRDAIINNNPTLKANPDHVEAGKTYWIPAPEAATVRE